MYLDWNEHTGNESLFFMHYASVIKDNAQIGHIAATISGKVDAAGEAVVDSRPFFKRMNDKVLGGLCASQLFDFGHILMINLGGLNLERLYKSN